LQDEVIAKDEENYLLIANLKEENSRVLK
jgi:hypothetical protein